jgi:hypothetical protein
VEELYSPSLKSQKDCRYLQQKVQEEVQETNRLLENAEKHLGALQDCQSNLRLEEQQLQSQIDETVLKINMLTEERESVTEQKVCCMCCCYYLPSPWSYNLRLQLCHNQSPSLDVMLSHSPSPANVRASFPEFHHSDIFPAS